MQRLCRATPAKAAKIVDTISAALKALLTKPTVFSIVIMVGNGSGRVNARIN